MAASVRIEDEAFADERYDALARAAGLADADHARGKMARLWRQSAGSCSIRSAAPARPASWRCGTDDDSSESS